MDLVGVGVRHSIKSDSSGDFPFFFTCGILGMLVFIPSSVQPSFAVQNGTLMTL